MSLAKKIIQLRKERNLTQKELAKLVGVHFSHMSRYERGLAVPSVDVIKRIAQMFRVSADYLLFDDTDAMVWAPILDQELLRQFELIARMGEREKSAVKTILEGVILKHRLEAMLGVQSPSGQGTTESSATHPSLSWAPILEQDLQHLNGLLADGRRRS